jgi:microcompartment protein CcmK/EutM
MLAQYVSRFSGNSATFASHDAVQKGLLLATLTGEGEGEAAGAVASESSTGDGEGEGSATSSGRNSAQASQPAQSPVAHCDAFSSGNLSNCFWHHD